MNRPIATILGVMLVLAGLPAHSTPIQWMLQDVAFEDGGTASGSFVFDAGTATFSAISITTTRGTSSAGGLVDALLAGDALAAALVPQQADLSGAPLLQLMFLAPLTSAGGVVSLVDPFFPENSSSEGHCSNANCSSASFARFVSSGNVVGTPVPLPAGAGLLAGALLTASLRRPRKS